MSGFTPTCTFKVIIYNKYIDKMRPKSEKHVLRPLAQSKHLQNRTKTAAFFFQEPKQKVPFIRVNTSINAFQSNASIEIYSQKNPAFTDTALSTIPVSSKTES